MHVLIIEDNADLAGNLVDYLEARGHTVDAAADGLTGLHLAVSDNFDVIVLDLGLPALDGIGVCRRLRAEGYSTPIIMLTARGELESRIAGLDTGADDYLIKPVSLRELEARLRAQVRRAHGGLEHRQLRVEDLILDESTMTVTRGGQRLTLTRLDFELLRILMRESPAVLTRARLEAELWGEGAPDTDNLKVHIHRLRRAIDQPFTTPLLHTVRGVGYRLVRDDFC